MKPRYPQENQKLWFTELVHNTPLLQSYLSEHSEIVNWQDDTGKTLLHYAAYEVALTQSIYSFLMVQM